LNYGKTRKKAPQFPAWIFSLFTAGILILSGCSFDYGAVGDSGDEKPDIIMEQIEYVRVRGGDPLVRFYAEHAERWEERQTMELRDFTFEQLESSGEEVNAEGRAGTATVQLDTGNVSMRDGVRINIESEDIIIKTQELEWIDAEKNLFSGDYEIVEIERSDGTRFTGRGFHADARRWTWSFSGGVEGTFVEEDDDEEDE
jgi:LPS export ABC transporter protein LptC